ncbi:MAG: FliM/FliN family flagellar motor switch protein [Epsilonproteobacteria bacterium]|nr:flagellar motor switch protein FliN [Campylobacterota bacterium]NPA56891.1 FliM/FliN family flagellar motor switch protein [Campylobacterota bacterium]
MENVVDPKIEFLSDVKLRVSANVGRIEKLLIEILSLKEGDIIELDKNIEEYIEIRVNDKTFAIGEIVVANEKYGVRIVDLA